VVTGLESAGTAVAPEEPGADMKGYGILVRVVVEVFGSGGGLEVEDGRQCSHVTVALGGIGRRQHSHRRKSGPRR
jgi:hypothetical protein